MGIENVLITLFRINFNKMEFLRIYTHVRCHFKWIVVKVGDYLLHQYQAPRGDKLTNMIRSSQKQPNTPV